MRFTRWVLLSAGALPMASAFAQPGFNFRPLEADESPMPQQVAPGWRPEGGAPVQRPAPPPVDDQMGYRFAPQTAETPTASTPPMNPSGFPNFRYKPEESDVSGSHPPPLPPAMDTVQDPAMNTYGMPSPGAQQGAGQPMNTGLPPFSPPFTAGEPPPRPERPKRPEPPPMPQPLQLEGRYIDGAQRYQQQSYPFRPLEEETPQDKHSSSGVPPQPAPTDTGSYTQPTYQTGYQYPAVPQLNPGYAPLPYDPGYNSGPSFNGFRFPFGGNGFPFSFK